MTLEVRTVIYLRARIEALRLEQPITASAKDMLAATIAELEEQARLVASGHWPLRLPDAHLGAVEHTGGR